MIECRAAQKESFKILVLCLEKLIHQVHRLIKLVDLDIAAGTEQIAVLDDLINSLIFTFKLEVQFFDSEWVYRLVKMS